MSRSTDGQRAHDIGQALDFGRALRLRHRCLPALRTIGQCQCDEAATGKAHDNVVAGEAQFGRTAQRQRRRIAHVLPAALAAFGFVGGDAMVGGTHDHEIAADERRRSNVARRLRLPHQLAVGTEGLHLPADRHYRHGVAVGTDSGADLRADLIAPDGLAGLGRNAGQGAVAGGGIDRVLQHRRLQVHALARADRHAPARLHVERVLDRREFDRLQRRVLGLEHPVPQRARGQQQDDRKHCGTLHDTSQHGSGGAHVGGHVRTQQGARRASVAPARAADARARRGRAPAGRPCEPRRACPGRTARRRVGRPLPRAAPARPRH